jgi:hypothetical protein
LETFKWLNGWLAALHPLLETLYYIAAIALAGIAYKGLEQLKIAKETARTNARREAFKLAADECRTFAERVVPLSLPLSDECERMDLKSFVEPQFKVVDGEITDHKFSLDVIGDDVDKCTDNLVAFVNALEAFAIFFAAGIADESVAYRETGLAFCNFAATYMPAIYLLRSENDGRFESTLKLYELWSARIASESLRKAAASAKTSLEAMESKLKRGRIKTIGDE